MTAFSFHRFGTSVAKLLMRFKKRIRLSSLRVWWEPRTISYPSPLNSPLNEVSQSASWSRLPKRQLGKCSRQIGLECSSLIFSTALLTVLAKITTTTTRTILLLSGFSPGQPGWAGTRRNIHPLTPIVVISHPLSTSSIYYNPWYPPCSIYVPDSLFAQFLSKFSLGLPLGLATSTSYSIHFFQVLETHTHTTVLRLCGICPGKPGWAGTRRTFTHYSHRSHQSSLSAFSI